MTDNTLIGLYTVFVIGVITVTMCLKNYAIRQQKRVQPRSDPNGFVLGFALSTNYGTVVAMGKSQSFAKFDGNQGYISMMKRHGSKGPFQSAVLKLIYPLIQCIRILRQAMDKASSRDITRLIHMVQRLKKLVEKDHPGLSAGAVLTVPSFLDISDEDIEEVLERVGLVRLTGHFSTEIAQPTQIQAALAGSRCGSSCGQIYHEIRGKKNNLGSCHEMIFVVYTTECLTVESAAMGLPNIQGYKTRKLAIDFRLGSKSCRKPKYGEQVRALIQDVACEMHPEPERVLVLVTGESAGFAEFQLHVHDVMAKRGIFEAQYQDGTFVTANGAAKLASCSREVNLRSRNDNFIL